ncbi:MAG TPA: MBL fold metallo-hydrolase [Hyphomonadaceae bacterium]|nr:MBL fold metallo-hydrolase [Hyphomonadaceae bacterium]
MQRTILACCLGLIAACASTPAGEQGHTFIPGSFAPQRQPDGNSIVLNAEGGVIVVDTGRHAAHTQQVIEAAKVHGGVLAIINTHWHLDHTSGNIALREAYPSVEIYANAAALHDALSGFLARGLVNNRRTLADPTTPAGLADDLRGDIATVEQGEKLRPTVSVEAPRMLTIGGRSIEVHTAKAASAGDLWLYDVRERLLISGDLVTLPAPFLDTACPEAWRAEFKAILGTSFAQLIPGHGRPMTRKDVETYRDGFGALLDCAKGNAAPAVCAAAWATTAAPLLDGSTGDVGQAEAYARYYVENVLRNPQSRQAWCRG